ncbi:hypothetical protein D3C80_1156440 [compost metagenome]
MKAIIAAGFAAVVITIIACTYVLNTTIKRYSFDGGDITSAIERQGELTRDAIRGQPKPVEPDPVLPLWFNRQ